MPMFSLSEDFIKLRKEKIEEIRKRKQKTKKITLIFKKDYDIYDKSDFKKIYKDLETLSLSNLFDEIYIIKDDRVLTENEIKNIYRNIRAKEDEEFKNKILSLSKVIERLIVLIEYFKKTKS
ncbi:hypothetical protein BA065_02530 [Nanoarchaeota archaeon NZ13-N]|nr:MAG: hypothetical protein BA065_02530 [Nanoarchaeota archaeon NZ13-N]